MPHPELDLLSREIKFQTVVIGNPRDVVRYSFIAHNSISHLDLSSCEYGGMEKLVYTREAYRKLVEENRRILYDYHLDESIGLLDCNFADIPEEKTGHTLTTGTAFHLGKISIPDSVYTADFANIIFNVINRSTDKVREIRRLLPAVRTLNIDYDEALLLCECFFDALYDETPDSILLEQCIEVFDADALHYALLEQNNTLLVDILRRAQIMRVDLSCFERESILICTYLFEGSIENIETLIEYGYGTHLFQDWDIRYTEEYYDLPPQFIEEYEKYESENPNRYRRYLLSFQVVYKCELNRSDGGLSTEICRRELKIIWDSIPDPYLSFAEIANDLSRFNLHSEAFLVTDWLFYQSSVCRKVEYFQNPRSLCHLSRISIRETLKKAWTLPKGIESLSLPNRLKHYIRLEKDIL